MVISRRWNQRVERCVRVAGAAVLLAASVGVPAASPAPAQAGNLAWSDVRPPLTDEADTNGADGYTPLPTFGAVPHAIVVAPNGDVFAGGGVGGLRVFRSTTGGLSWRSAGVSGTSGSVAVRAIVVSPDYPADNWVGVLFSDDVADGTGDNGLCWSTDGAQSFPPASCLMSTAGPDGILDDIRLLTIAVSPDFNWTNGNGELSVGGNQEAGLSSVATAQVSALRSTPAITDFIFKTDPDGDVGDATGHLAYTYDEEPITLARLWVNANAAGDGAGATGTYGQVLFSGSWPNALTSSRIASEIADAGQVAFDDEYSSGGSFFAAVSLPGAAVGGVFRFDGSVWTNKTAVDDVCNADISSFTVTGNGSATKIVATRPGSNIVCRSTNEGSSWSDNDADGGDDVCNECGVNPTGSITMVASRREQPNVVYYSTSATLGGVFRSDSTGSSWRDTGLTNLSYTVGAVRELDPSRAFAVVTAPSGEDALFFTGNYGADAAWQRVLRTSRTDLSFGPGVGDVLTTGKTFARFNSTGVTPDKILVTTNGGMTWDDGANPDPFENAPEPNENVVAERILTSSLVYYGGDRGHVSRTFDGGQTWTVLAKDFGNDIDEFDFSTNPAVFFVVVQDFDFTNKVWITGDSGVTFSQVGTTPWGNGNGSIDLHIGGYDPVANSGYLIVVTGQETAVDDVWRLQLPGGNWEPLGLGIDWTSSDMVPTVGAGDGQALMLWKNNTGGAAKFFYTFHPFTGAPALMQPVSGAIPGQNLLLELPAPPVPSAFTLSSALTLPGLTRQFVANNRIMELTLTGDWATKPVPSIPANGALVPTNLGTDGFPVVLRWGAVTGADTYQVRIGLTPDFSDAVALGLGGGSDPLITGPQAIVDAPRYALIPGSVYFWQVQVQSAGGTYAEEGPWSDTRAFGVVPSVAGGVGGKNLTIRAGASSPTSIDLTWDQGGAQAGYQVRRFDIGAGTDALIGGTLPKAATSLSDSGAVAGSLYCYVVLPVDAGDTILGISDLECAVSGMAAGSAAPGDFALRLNQSAITTLSWDAPVGGADGFILVVIPLDGTPTLNVSFDPTVRAVSRAEQGGRPTCYLLAAVQGTAFGNTNLLCGLPGFATLAAPSTGTAAGAAPETAVKQPNRKPATYTLEQLRNRFKQATAEVRGKGKGVAERAKQSVEKVQPKQPKQLNVGGRQR